MCPKLTLRLVALAIGLWPSAAAVAGEADVVKVDVRIDGNGTYRFEVTVTHGDTGWEHYADRWEVVAPDGTVMASRVLLHPHVDEQPFTRSLGSVAVPDGMKEVIIRAHDNMHGSGGKEMIVSLP